MTSGRILTVGALLLVGALSLRAWAQSNTQSSPVPSGSDQTALAANPAARFPVVSGSNLERRKVLVLQESSLDLGAIEVLRTAGVNVHRLERAKNRVGRLRGVESTSSLRGLGSWSRPSILSRGGRWRRVGQ